MKINEALLILSRQAPCPHENADTRLGNGKVWAKCEDCGTTFQQDNWDMSRKAATEFEEAIETVRNAV